MRAGFEPAWVLAQRPYGNSGKIVEFFSLHQGRLSAVARGIQRKALGGQSSQLLQLFYPLLIETTGRNELKTLVGVEPAGIALRPEGEASLCGMYLNELLTRLLPRFDPYPVVFARYGEAIGALSKGVTSPALRRFELELLAELGYPLDWCRDANQEPIDAASCYNFVAGSGFIDAEQNGRGRYPGAAIVAIGDWLLSGDAASCPSGLMIVCRDVIREALAPLLGDKPLRTRQIARALINSDSEA